MGRMSVEPIVYPLLFLAAVLAGLVDSIAGGGGLITVPALLAAGLPPQLVLGTNKLQASFGSFTAAVNYTRQGMVDLRQSAWGVGFTFLGAVAGACVVQSLPGELLKRIIPLLLLAIVVYMLARPSLGELDLRPRMPAVAFYAVFGLAIGFYDGFFGPGTGSFWLIALMLGLGLNVTRATGTTKVMNFTSNIVALTVFAIGGHVQIAIGMTMAVGEILGAMIGSTMVIRRGARFIRPVFLTVVVLTTIKLLYDAWTGR